MTNPKIKFGESFRPFAPSVLREAAAFIDPLRVRLWLLRGHYE